MRLQETKVSISARALVSCSAAKPPALDPLVRMYQHRLRDFVACQCFAPIHFIHSPSAGSPLRSDSHLPSPPGYAGRRQTRIWPFPLRLASPAVYHYGKPANWLFGKPRGFARFQRGVRPGLFGAHPGYGANQTNQRRSVLKISEK